MKTLKLLFLTFIIISTMSISAQVKVISSGNVGIGHINPNAKLVIKDGTSETKLQICNGDWGETYGLTFKSFGQSSGFNGGKLHINSNSNFNFCFYNQYSGKEYRVGIGTLTPTCALDIYGVVKVDGETVHGSDIRLKEDILAIDNNLGTISKLRPVKYYLKNWDLLQAYSMDPITEDSTNIEDQLKSANKRVHYGFIAQEIRDVLPELVYEDEKGYLSIDYNGIIPLLVSAIKEQQSQIEAQQAEIVELKSKDSKTKSTADNNFNNNSVLFQNQPNPFSENTYINYIIPDDVNKAVIYIYNLQGRQVKVIDINERGQGSAVIYGSELYAGTYHYTLITDGQIVGTYTMILTD